MDLCIWVEGVVVWVGRPSQTVGVVARHVRRVAERIRAADFELRVFCQVVITVVDAVERHPRVVAHVATVVDVTAVVPAHALAGGQHTCVCANKRSGHVVPKPC